MEPWQRARDLLKGKWQAYQNHAEWPAASLGDCVSCDENETPHCLTCARLLREGKAL